MTETRQRRTSQETIFYLTSNQELDLGTNQRPAFFKAFFKIRFALVYHLYPIRITLTRRIKSSTFSECIEFNMDCQSRRQQNLSS